MTFLDSTEATPKVPDIEHAPPPLPDKRRRGIYILPNLFTTAALFAGFYAIVQAMNQRFEYAAVAIFVAMVLDGLDGRIARMTNTQSEFGAEYDSLSDMVSFGAAPALVMYEWALQDLGKLGWVAAFIYCAGAALRLARFNTNIDVVDKRYFQGLPSPAAAALVAGMVWVGIDNGFAGNDLILQLVVPCGRGGAPVTRPCRAIRDPGAAAPEPVRRSRPPGRGCDGTRVRSIMRLRSSPGALPGGGRPYTG